VFAASEQEVEKRRLGVKRVGEHQVEGPRIGGDHARQQAQGRFHFILAGPLRLMIQEQAHGLPSWQRTRQQHQRNLPMIKLNAIPSRRVDGSLQTARAMTQVTGVAFVTVENDDSQAVNIRQSLVAFQALVNIMNPLPQPVGIEHRMDSSQGVGTEGRLFEPTLPEAGPADLLPSVDAAQPGPEQHQ